MLKTSLKNGKIKLTLIKFNKVNYNLHYEMIEKYFTTEQVANILQVHPFTILKLIKVGKLKGIKLGRVYRIKEDDVKDFLENSSTQKRSKKEEGQELPKKLEEEEHESKYEIKEKKASNEEDQHYYLI